VGKILVDEDEAAEHAEDMIMRHRLDLAKLYLGKDGGYSLRKFKRIFKREMEEHPEKYSILQKG
jgi:methylphosphotriester-DNA--protein-cysteine methyltransferase